MNQFSQKIFYFQEDNIRNVYVKIAD